MQNDDEALLTHPLRMPKVMQANQSVRTIIIKKLISTRPGVLLM